MAGSMMLRVQALHLYLIFDIKSVWRLSDSQGMDRTDTHCLHSSKTLKWRHEGFSTASPTSYAEASPLADGMATLTYGPRR